MEMLLHDDDDLLQELDAVEFICQYVPRKIYTRADHFTMFNERDFSLRFRLTKASVYELLVLIEEKLEYNYDINNSISPMNQLLITLLVFATEGHLLAFADFGGMHVSTVSRIIVRVSRAIAELANRFIKMPSTYINKMNTQNKFYEIASFPRVIGVIDCTNVKIQSPGGEDPEIFRSRKSYFSINVQVIGNWNYEIINIVARWPGSAHDSTIFNNSRIRMEFETNLYPNALSLGDSGYNILTYLLTPHMDPQTPAEQLYNESHIRTRVRIENIFGIWKRRFPILAYGCRLKLKTVLTIIVATAILHNIAKKNNEPEPLPDPDIDQHLLRRLIQDGQIPNIPNPGNQERGAGYEVRADFINNFFGML